MILETLELVGGYILAGGIVVAFAATTIAGVAALLTGRSITWRKWSRR